MKKNYLFYLFFCFTVIAFFISCKCNEQSKPCLSKEDSAKIANWDLLFQKKPSSGGKMMPTSNSQNNRPVYYEYGKACVDEFENFFKTISINDLPNFMTEIYTKDVMFYNNGSDGIGGPNPTNSLFSWIGKQISSYPNCTGFKICFGKYKDPTQFVHYDASGHDDGTGLDQKVADHITGRVPGEPGYPNSSIDPKKSKIGRITVFIRPFPFLSHKTLSTAPLPPPPGDDDYFNLGEINPPKP